MKLSTKIIINAQVNAQVEEIQVELLVHNDDTRVVFITDRTLFEGNSNMVDIKGVSEINCCSDEVFFDDIATDAIFHTLKPWESIYVLFDLKKDYCNFNNVSEGNYVLYFNKLIESCDAPNLKACEFEYYSTTTEFYLNNITGELPD